MVAKSNRASARECALAHSFFVQEKQELIRPVIDVSFTGLPDLTGNFSKQTPSGSGICSAFDAEIHLEIKSAAFWTETEKSTPFSASAIRIEAKISPVPCRDGPAEGVRQAR